MPANTALGTPSSASVLLRLTTMAAACLLTTACAVGPDFKTPEAPKVSGYTPQPLPHQTSTAATQGGEAQRFVSGMPVSDQWWKTFQSEKLNKTIANAIAASPTLAAAQAALRDHLEPAVGEQRAEFLQLARIAAGQDDAPHVRSPGRR